MSTDTGGIPEIARKAFEAVDDDNNGYISFEELEACMRNVATHLGQPEPTTEAIRQTTGALDTNYDGKISLEEFSVLVNDLFVAIIEAKESN